MSEGHTSPGRGSDGAGGRSLVRTASRCFALAAGVVLAVLIQGAASSRGNGLESGHLDLAGYTLTFNEDFDRLSVSALGPARSPGTVSGTGIGTDATAPTEAPAGEGTRWIAHTPWGGDFGNAVFTDPRPGFPFTVENGILRIEARKGSDGRWRAGLLSSADAMGRGFLQQYGYFEMRAKLPEGAGLWPAFWLVGSVDPVTSAEIDIMEHYGVMPGQLVSTVHVWPKQKGERHRAQALRARFAPGLLYRDFHTYGASVEEEEIVFYLDRVEIGRLPTPPEHRRPMFILLDLALGGGWPSKNAPSPSFMYVDYVRAWRRN